MKVNQQFSRDQIKSGTKTGKIFNKDLNLINKDFEKTTLRFVIVSSVFPDFEIIIKQEFFKI